MKYLCHICIVHICLFSITLGIDSLQSPLKVNIQEIDKKSSIAELPAMDLRIGETGLVWHKFDENYKSIIAYATIIRIDSGVAYATLDNQDILEQKYLPLPTNKPIINDEIFFRTLNNLAFIIAPTLESYDRVRMQHPQVQFLNSDLIMGYLFDVGGFDPKPKFFNKVCQVYNVGLLYVVTTNKLNILDCQSLVVLQQYDFDTSEAKSNKTIAPFFFFFQYASSGSLDGVLKSKKSRQYFEYYDTFVAQGKDFKP